mgnify:FL=1|tara:strand:- start:407 stop:571 length:165 start_codon:yes stop_codon:yes gene_type:complete
MKIEKKKRAVSVWLTLEEWDALKVVSTSNCRSVAGQAAWFIKSGVARPLPPKAE